MSGEIWAREALYVGEHVSQWMGPDNKPWRHRWGLFVPSKKDGTPDNRYNPRRSKQHLIEWRDGSAKLFERGKNKKYSLSIEYPALPFGAPWDVEEVWSL